MLSWLFCQAAPILGDGGVRLGQRLKDRQGGLLRLQRLGTPADGAQQVADVVVAVGQAVLDPDVLGIVRGKPFVDRQGGLEPLHRINWPTKVPEHAAELEVEGLQLTISGDQLVVGICKRLILDLQIISRFRLHCGHQAQADNAHEQRRRRRRRRRAVPAGPATGSWVHGSQKAATGSSAR